MPLTSRSRRRARPRSLSIRLAMASSTVALAVIAATATTATAAATATTTISAHATAPRGSNGPLTPTGALPFPVPVRVGHARQVITVRARGSYATVTAWQQTGGIWRQMYSTEHARIAAHGLASGTTRHQGSRTTPTGTYTITQGFGLGANPGTRMPYRRLRPDDWWVEDPSSRYYNQMRSARKGGFPRTEAGVHGSEHLISHPVQYHHALVINYNTDPAIRGRGAGIFLHDLGPHGGPTAGCVAVPRSMLTRIMRWIDPAEHPVIAIG